MRGVVISDDLIQDLSLFLRDERGPKARRLLRRITEEVEARRKPSAVPIPYPAVEVNGEYFPYIASGVEPMSGAGWFSFLVPQARIPEMNRVLAVNANLTSFGFHDAAGHPAPRYFGITVIGLRLDPQGEDGIYRVVVDEVNAERVAY